MAVRSYGATIVRSQFGWPTTYEIVVQFPNGARTIEKRYTDFETLRGNLGSEADSLPPLPPKSRLKMLDNSFRGDRQEGLERFLSAAIEKYPMLESEALVEFLEATIEDVQAVRASTAETTPSAADETDGRMAPHHEPQERQSATGEGDGGMSLSEGAAPDEAAENTQAELSGTGSAPSALEELRALRRQQWERQRGGPTPVAAAKDARVAAPPVTRPTDAAASSGASPPAAPEDATPEVLQRLQLLPLQELPAEYDGSSSRLQLLREPLLQLRAAETVLEKGCVVSAECSQFVVVACTPPKGVVGPSTVYYLDGPAVPGCQRVQFITLRPRREASDTQESLLSEYVMPYLRESLTEGSRRALIAPRESVEMAGVLFYVHATEPSSVCVINEQTVLHAHPDDVDEFQRIHVIPFTDTLPSAYEYDVFNDYVRPFFSTHVLDRFRVGQTFYHNSVQFRVVAAEPSDQPCRVGRTTLVWCEGSLQPTPRNLLSQEHAQRLATLPPGLQMILLQSDMFGDGDSAERIIREQERRLQLTQTGVNRAVLQTSTQEGEWSEQLRSRMRVEQTECMVCLCEFHDGDRVRVLPCNHIFHTACVDEWLGRDTHCPLCRHSFSNRRRSR